MGTAFPWYDFNSFITIEGPTKKYSIVHVLVSIFKKKLKVNHTFERD